MKTIMKFAAAAALTGALAMTMATPSQAHDGRIGAAVGGFAAGAVVGAAAASAANGGYYGPAYYDRGYAYGPTYVEEPGYAYEPAYAYQPAPTYVQETYAPAYASRGCWVSTDNTRGYGYYGGCASHNQDTDAATLGETRRNVRAVR